MASRSVDSHVCRRLLSVLVVSLSVLPSAALPSLAPAAAAAPTASAPDEAADEHSATAAAKAGNKSVRVLNQTDETTELRAQPDGSFKWTQYRRPVRVKQSGKWTPVDTTLVRRPDGTVAPKATVVDLTLSGGGAADSPTVKVAKDGVEVGLGWQGDLPEPVLTGPTATYPEVLPGVDMKVTADVTGFSQVLVVKTPEAARNPNLRRISFDSYSQGAKVKKVGEDLQAGENGPVFSGTASRMWDSSGNGSEQDRLTGSGEGTRSASMGVQVSDTAIAIEPDQAFLTAADTKYPVYLDPSYGCKDCGKAHHAVVQSAWPEAPNWDRTDGKLNDLKAGYVCEEGVCFISRTYLLMKTAELSGKIIKKAHLHVDVINSFHCGSQATPTELHHAYGFGPTITWGHQPGWNGHQSSGSACDGAGIDLEAHSLITAAAAGGWGETAMVLKGQDEGNNRSWRRFALNPYLIVEYNSPPNVPTHLGMDGWGPNPGDAKPCSIGAGRAYVGKTPRLRAMISDPDGGMMDAGFVLSRGAAGSGQAVKEFYKANIPSGTFAEVAVDGNTINTDGLWHWALWAGDGEPRVSSGYCEMMVDSEAPGMPGVSSVQYPKDQTSGGVGKTGSFTFTPPLLDQFRLDDVHFEYSVMTHDGDDPRTKVVPTSPYGSVTISWTPSVSGPEYLKVVAVDKAGNRSEPAVYNFNVSDYQVGVSGKVAHWSFEDSLADTSDAKTLSYTGTPPPGGVFGDGHQGRGASLGTQNQGHYEARDALTRTDTSFTVSAWAKLATNNGQLTVLSQDGEQASGMRLRYDSDASNWAFAFNDQAVKAISTQPVTLDWTHLTGVYDATAKKARIYVNGVRAGEADVPVTPGNAKNQFIVGAVKVGDRGEQHFKGMIDSVRVHARLLADSEISSLHAGTSNAAPTAEYLFENNLLNTGANTNLAGGSPGYATGYAGKAMKYDQSSGTRPMSAGPIVAVTDSFSVSAWVKLNDTDGHYAIAGQDGNHTSGFVLKHASDVDRWALGIASADETADRMQWAIGTSLPRAAEWTHLAAVHDTNTHKILLYVNGVLEAEREIATTFTTTGPFVVGDLKFADERGGKVNGMIDEVSVYDGALTTEEARKLANVPVERARYRLNETSGNTAADSVGSQPAKLYGSGVTWDQTNGSSAAKFPGHQAEHHGVLPGVAPVAGWAFEQNLNEMNGNGVNLRHTRGATEAPASFTLGHPGLGASFNGTDQRMSTTSTVVRTEASYSIAARVKLDRANGRFTVVSQSGSITTPFLLQYAEVENRWAFTMADSNTGSTGTNRAYSKEPPKLSTWTHLVGVYDAAAGRARLYVNGILEGETAVNPGWVSNGVLTVGWDRWGGQAGGHFAGVIDEVRVFDRILGASEAHGLWNLGSNIEAPYDAHFNATKSFTVSAWVRHDGFDEPARQAVSSGAVDGFSPFMVGYRSGWNRWGVMVTTKVIDGNPHPKFILSDNEAQTYVREDGWVHLTVTYDAPNRRVRLYVNGEQQTTTALDATTIVKVDPTKPIPPFYAGVDTAIGNPGRHLLVGRTTWGGTATDYWKGSLRDVRAFTGVVQEECDSFASICIRSLVTG